MIDKICKKLTKILSFMLLVVTFISAGIIAYSVLNSKTEKIEAKSTATKNITLHFIKDGLCDDVVMSVTPNQKNATVTKQNSDVFGTIYVVKNYMTNNLCLDYSFFETDQIFQINFSGGYDSTYSGIESKEGNASYFSNESYTVSFVQYKTDYVQTTYKTLSSNNGTISIFGVNDVYFRVVYSKVLVGTVNISPSSYGKIENSFKLLGGSSSIFTMAQGSVITIEKGNSLGDSWTLLAGGIEMARFTPITTDDDNVYYVSKVTMTNDIDGTIVLGETDSSSLATNGKVYSGNTVNDDTVFNVTFERTGRKYATLNVEFNDHDAFGLTESTLTCEIEKYKTLSVETQNIGEKPGSTVIISYDQEGSAATKELTLTTVENEKGVYYIDSDTATDIYVKVTDPDTSVEYTYSIANYAKYYPTVVGDVTIYIKSKADYKNYYVTFMYDEYSNEQESKERSFNAVTVENSGVYLGDAYVFTRDGYKQIGWSTEVDSSEVEYAIGASYKELKDITLYPVWEKIGTVEFVTNCDTCTLDPVYSEYGEYVSLPSPGQIGYKFTGWYTDEDLTNKVEDQDNFCVDQDYVLYAGWKEGQSLTVTFINAANVTSTKLVNDFDVENYDPEVGFMLPGTGYLYPSPNRSNYYQRYWKITAVGSDGPQPWYVNRTFGVDECVTGIENVYSIEFQCVYESAVTVYYWSNETSFGGTTNKSHIEHVFLPTSDSDDEAVELLPLNYYTYEGHKNVAWFTSETKAGGGVNLSVALAYGSSYSISDNEIDAYAIWEEGEPDVYFKVYYYPTISGTVQDQGITYDSSFDDSVYVIMTGEEDQTVTLPDETYYRLGYTQTGWSVYGADSVCPPGTISETYGLGEELNIGRFYNEIETPWYGDGTTGTVRSITLIPVWEVLGYTVKYDANAEGATGTVADQMFNFYTSTITLTSKKYSLEGGTFIGWNTLPDGTGISYTSGQSLSEPLCSAIGDEITLYAQWSTNTITFESNGGSEVEPLIAATGSVITAPEAPTKDEFEFVGWYSDEALTKEYTFSVMPSEDITLYAKWKTDVYTISYELNDGVVDGTNPTAYHSSKGIILINPTKEGYVFIAWEDELGEKYTEVDRNLTFTGDKTFTAIYGDPLYTITEDDVEEFETYYSYTSKNVINLDSIVINKNGALLEKDVDYTITVDGDDLINARENFRLRIEGIGNYCGIVDYWVTITPYQLSEANIASAINFEKTWDGEAIDFENDITIIALGKTLVYGTDYEIGCMTDSDAGGTHEVEITSLNPNFKGCTVTYTVNALTEEEMDESLLEYTLNNDTYPYTGEVCDLDYMITYNGYDVKDAATITYYTDAEHTTPAGAVDAGEYYFVLVTDGSSIPSQTYEGMITITKLGIGDCEADEGPYPYTGSNPDTMIVVTDENGRVLILDEDYTLTFEDDGYEIGDHEVTITGINNYEGTLTAPYTIRQIDLEEDADIIEISSDSKPGDEDWPKVIIGGKEVTLPNDDFDIKIEVEEPEGSGNWVEATKPYSADGNYRVTITGKEPNATGTVEIPVVINVDPDTLNVIQILDASGYEWISYHLFMDIYEDEGDVYEDDYYYRSGYTQLDMVHGLDDIEAAKVVLGNIPYKTTLADFLANLKTDSAYVRITGKDGEIYYDCGGVPTELLEAWEVSEEEFMNDPEYFAIGTGTKVEYVIGDTVYDTIYISVLGDINGDGFYTASDYNALKTYIKAGALKDCDEEIKLASYLFNKGAIDGKLSAIEYNSLRNYIKKEPEKIQTYFVSKDGTSETGAEMGRNTSLKAPEKECRITYVYHCVTTVEDTKETY